MPTIRITPTVTQMSKHTKCAQIYVRLLRGVEMWLSEGVAYNHDIQNKTVYFKRRTFRAKIEYATYPPFVIESIFKILDTYYIVQ